MSNLLKKGYTMKRVVMFLYGLVTYIFFLGIFLYAIGFVGNILVPKSIDSEVTDPLGIAILINALVLGLFAIQHTIMARPAFKAKLTKIIPKAAERSTFVLITNIIFVLIFWQWRPLGGTVWHLDSALGSAILHGLFWLGWSIVLVSTFLIDHFDLFGLRQVTFYLLKKDYYAPRFQEKSLYKIVRHPIMLGFLIAFWATPTMSMGRLFFAVLCTGYILVGLTFEERDLIKHHGELYLQYARRVPKLIPFPKFNRSGRKPGLEYGEEALTK
jgi:protein-S-isoprenylcysteine O-methyltransferase Ste14